MGQSRRIIGVYSPIGRCGKTCLALAIGQILAKEEKVLFVTLDTFTGFTGLLNERWKRDLSDLIYYYKQDRFHVIRLNSIVYYLGTWRGSRRSAFHRTIRSCRCRRWRIFWNGSCRKEIIRRWFSMWGLRAGCAAVTGKMPGDLHADPGGPVFCRKMREFEEYLEAVGNGAVMEKIQKIHVPMVTGGRRMEHFPRNFCGGYG